MRAFSAVILAATLAAFACGDSASSPTSPSTAGGTFNLLLKDSPFSDARSLLVTFSEVTAHRSGEGGFTRLPFASGATSRTCDLKRLQTSQEVLGTGPLPPGHYTQIRLVVSSAVLYFDNATTGPACAAAMTAPGGRSAPVEIASGEVKLNRQFELTSTTATTMLLDFDGDRSVNERRPGFYSMNPVISIVSVQ